MYMHSKEAGNSYYYYGYSDGKALCSATGGSETKVQKCSEWKNGDTITLFLDCEDGKITFWRNKERLGTLEIEKGTRYYPAMCECHCKGNVDHVLITL